MAKIKQSFANQKFKKGVFPKALVQTGKLSSMVLKMLFVVGDTTLNQLFDPPSFKKVKFMDFKKLWNEPLFKFKIEDGISAKMQKKIPKRSSIYAALYRLQKQGLVSSSNNNWSLTKKGNDLIQPLFKLRSKYSMRDLKEIDGTLRLVIFDIPEKERKKRNWIRGELLYHDFIPLQKSVWKGHRPLLPEFIENIGFLGLSDCVHIFSVKDIGTIPD